MPTIEGFRVKNYGVLKDITMGRVISNTSQKPLTQLVTIIGKNGTAIEEMEAWLLGDFEAIKKSLSQCKSTRALYLCTGFNIRHLGKVSKNN